MSKSNTKSILTFSIIALVVFVILPFLFMSFYFGKNTDHKDTLSSQTNTSQQAIASNKAKTLAFQELEPLLVSKGTNICEVLATINTQKEDNLKTALEKFPTSDTERGQHLMLLNQKSLDEIKTKYDIDRRLLSKIFRVGKFNCN